MMARRPRSTPRSRLTAAVPPAPFLVLLSAGGAVLVSLPERLVAAGGLLLLLVTAVGLLVMVAAGCGLRGFGGWRGGMRGGQAVPP
jgi:hypothetical protein